MVGRAHRPPPVPALRPDARPRPRPSPGSIEHHLLMSADRLQPRHRRPQDRARLRQCRAEPGAPEAAAGAHRRRHPRRRAGRLERLEGPAAARALLRDRAGGRRRAHAARRPRPRRRSAGSLPCRIGRLAEGRGASASSTGTIPTTGCAPTRARRSSTPRWCAPPSAPATSSPATSPPTPSPPSPSCPLFAPNHPRLLALFAGACAAAGANISGAHISTTRDGFALDTFLLAREFEHDEDELRRARRIAETIEKLLKGEIRLSALMAKRREQRGSRSAPSRWRPRCSSTTRCPTSSPWSRWRASTGRACCSSSPTRSPTSTSTSPRAHITTFGEKAVDVFYVTDLTNKKITSPQRQKAIKERLLDVLGGWLPGP